MLASLLRASALSSGLLDGLRYYESVAMSGGGFSLCIVDENRGEHWVRLTWGECMGSSHPAKLCALLEERIVKVLADMGKLEKIPWEA